jgi:prepilin-type N-terminal cleavage/methylation domain-containing protein
MTQTTMPRPARSAQQQAGFTLVELTVALAILVTGMLGLVAGFDSSRKLSLVSERHATMSHIAEREIERLEGISYSQIALLPTDAPTHSTDPTNPDYYVTNGSPPTLNVDRTGSTTETVVTDPTGLVQHTQTQQQGLTTYDIYDYVTWTHDSTCAPSCTGTQNYKRLTVAVSVTSGLQPAPVYSTSSIADPTAEPAQGIQNGNPNNPVLSPTTHCLNASGQTIECVSGILSGNANTWYLHDWPATGGPPQPPSSDHPTHSTVGSPTNACTTSQQLATNPANTTGCPMPDLMDPNPSSGVPNPPPTCYHYSTDLGTTGYPCGALIQPTCGTTCGPPGSSSSGGGGGTGSPSDCNGGTWTNNLINGQSHLWVTPPITTTTTLTGDGSLTTFSQTTGGAQAIVSFCVEIYDVPPSGSAGTLTDILAWSPIALGGAAYIPPTDPSTSGNWPASTSQTSFVYNFRGSNGPAAIPAGDRIGIRMWIKANVNIPIDMIYDHPLYPASVQLNSQ